MKQFFRKKSEIQSWLDEHRITGYTIRVDLSVDVKVDVDLDGKSLSALPVRFNHVGRHFLCTGNNLTSLLGVPKTLGGSFFCDQNKLTSLLHAPQNVPESFDCQDNCLTSLCHGPVSVGNRFNCSQNDLENLDFVPKEVAGVFKCINNPRLGRIQDITDFEQIKKIMLEIEKIKEEKQLLNNEIIANGSGFKQSVNSKI